MAGTKSPYVGVGLPADEAQRLIRGEGRYVDDVHDEGFYHLGVVRSPFAHARILKVDTAAVERRAKLVLLPADIARIFGSALFFALQLPQAKLARMPTLASPIAKYLGQPVAGVIAADRYEAEDLAEQISVEYDPLDPVMDPLTAASHYSPGTAATLVHPDLGTNVSLDLTLKNGDVDGAFASADVVVKDNLRCHRVSPNPIEPRGVIASWSGGRLDLQASCQSVFQLRKAMSEVTGLSESQIHVRQLDVGGAFGSKTPAFPEYVLAAAGARATGRPVKWIESRRDHLMAAYQGRSASAELSFAARKNGVVLGIRGRVISDLGAFTFTINSNYGPFIAQQLTGPYRIPAAEVRVLNVFTNKVPTGPYRGAGRPEAAFFYERMMDLLADELRIDPVELRLRNLVDLSDMPYKTALGLTLDREDYKQIMRRATQLFDYPALRAEVQRARAGGRSLGLGVSSYIELNKAVMGESCAAYLQPDGSVRIVTGLGPHGQYHGTMLRQLAADQLGVEISRVSVDSGDSDQLQRGTGTFGSRSAVIGGAAVVQACEALKLRITAEASRISGESADSLVCAEGQVRSKTSGGVLFSLGDLATRTANAPLSASVYAEGGDIFSFGVHFAVVELDRDTGRFNVRRYFALDDAGRAINPLFTEAQIYGGIMQAVGEVYYEEVPYDERGQLLIAGIGDAGVPAATEGFDVDSVLFEYPSRYPHGARGVGEAGCIGGTPALVSASQDAIGVRLSSTGLRLDRVRSLLDEARK